MRNRLQCKLFSSILYLVLTSTWSFGGQIASGLQVQSSNSGSTATDITNAIPSVQVPHSASDILKLALDMNGLEVPSARPWHLKLSYNQFDEDGDNVHSGTVEEFYVGSKKFKRIYTTDTLSRVDIANDAGLFRTGDQSWPSMVESGVLNSALHPLDLARWDNRIRRPEKTELKFGNSKFPCVNLRDKEPGVIHFGAPVFCFE
ncbi:MAG: hypothetical protein WA672_07150, partial [Candidatus Angelobacter sp.]